MWREEGECERIEGEVTSWHISTLFRSFEQITNYVRILFGCFKKKRKKKRRSKAQEPILFNFTPVHWC
jgi:hypothetical protein